MSYDLPQIFKPDGEFVEPPNADTLPPEVRTALDRVRKCWNAVKGGERVRDEAQARIAAEVEEIRTVQPFAREWSRLDEVRAMIHAGGR